VLVSVSARFSTPTERTEGAFEALIASIVHQRRSYPPSSDMNISPIVSVWSFVLLIQLLDTIVLLQSNTT